MSCAGIQMMVWEWLDGELDARRQDDVRAHLDRCTPCRAQHDAALALLTTVARVRESDPAPATLLASVRTTLRARGITSS
jgi:mycothiol system anti-sigma-R factor